LTADYYRQIKLRAPDPSLVEIIAPVTESLPDDAVVAKIHGDIWSQGPIFCGFPDYCARIKAEKA
jgi:hypothetical protein